MTDLEWNWVEGPIAHNLLSEWSNHLSQQKDLGAFTFFCGQVRADQSEMGRVKGIEYSAYQKLVEAETQSFVKAHPLYHEIRLIKIAQSIGFVASGELSLLLLVATAHRKELLSFQQEMIEFLKFKVPVWKKEIFEDESHRWINA